MNLVTIGADPELFLQTHNEGKLISAIHKFGGTKEMPEPMEDYPKGFGVLEDNVMVEFNIPPANSSREFVENIQMSLGYIERKATNMGLGLSTLASGNFDKSELQDWEAFVFGCEPDYNAYTGDKNPKPNVDNEPDFRSCGGHVHVGAGKLSFEEICKAVPWCDLYLGIPSVFYDKDHKRKKLYGKAGAFRVKPYGFEYRTLSNFWIFNPDLIEWVYHATQQAVNQYRTGRDISKYYGLIQKAINENDKQAARDLCNIFNIKV